MKNLLRGLLSLTMLSGTIWPVVACSSSKVTENKEQDDEKSIIADEIKTFIINFFYGTKTSNEDETLNDFGVISFNELGINSISEFRQKIHNKESITDKEIVDLINKYLIESRIPELQKELQKQFKDIFAEDINDFVKLKDNDTQIKNDSASMKFSEIKKIVNGDTNNNQVGDVITNEILDDMFESIIKLNIQIEIELNSKKYNISVKPDFSYYITDKQEAAVEVFQKLKTIVENHLKTNMSKYYQEFLNHKLKNGKLTKKDLANLSTARVIKELLATYFNFNDLNAEALSFKYNKISPKILEAKEEDIDISQLINYKIDDLTYLIRRIFPEQIDSLRVRDKLMTKIKQDYNDKFKTKLKQDNEKSDVLLKLNITISRVSILGFAIGDIVINDVAINYDLSNIINDMYKAFEYLDNILSYFTIEKIKNWYIAYYPSDPIWDPKKYDQIPEIPDERPDTMPEKEYQEKRRQNINAIKEIGEKNLLNWINNKIEYELSISKDIQEKKPSFPKLAIEAKEWWFSPNTDFNKRVYISLDIILKIGLATLTVDTGFFYLFNEEV